MDPISIACITALAQVTGAMTIGTAVGGIVANRADSLFCKLMGGAADRFVANTRLPENHDLLQGLMDAYQRSISYVAVTMLGQACDLREQMLADKMVLAAKNHLSADGANAATLMPLLSPLIAGPGENEAGLRRERMIAVARDGLIAWFEKETSETLPEHFRRLFAEAAPNGRAPWSDVFRLYLAEVIKDKPRFERIFLASNVSEIVGRTITIETLVIELEKGLESLREQLGIVGADVKQILVVQDAQDQKIDQLLKMFSELPLAAQAREANVEARAFVVLARKINLEVDDEAQALNELNQAVEELLKIKAAAEHGTHVDALVDQTMRRIAEQSLRGEFDSAAAEAQSAFSNWERREAARRDRERQSGLTLIEANIGQHLLRRDSVAAAGWIERRIALENNGKPADAAALMAEIKVWYDRGCERGLNLDLSVAIALSRRAVVLSPAGEAGAAQNCLGNALSSLGERESGTGRLDEAVEAYREALKEYTRERVPLNWAATQNNLGTALRNLGERESGTGRLDEAVEAYREALKERTRERVPLHWAETLKNLTETEQLIKRKNQS